MGRGRPLDEDGFESLFRGQFAPTVRALTLVAGDREAAADAVQDAFLQAHRHWGRVSGLEDPAAWVRHAASTASGTSDEDRVGWSLRFRDW
jgi:DNA-directed RNA polymerase specialized sigma24 family protein